MGIMNLLSKKGKKRNVYKLHQQYAEKTITHREYNQKLTQALIEAFFPADALDILKKNNMDILFIDRDIRPNCTLQEIIRLAQTCRMATAGMSQLFKVAKERIKEKDSNPENFASRYAGIEVISSIEWENIYAGIPEKTFPKSMQNFDSMWNSFVLDASSFALLLDRVVSKYSEMIAGQASFACKT